MVLICNSKKFIFIKPYLCDGRYIEYNFTKNIVLIRMIL